MPRPILDESHIHPAIREKIANHEQGIVREVQAAIAKQPMVFVKGVLVGGATDLIKLIDSGELKALLA